MWNIKKIVSKGDYNYALVSEHPNSTTNGYVLQHRIVMENHLGRLLDANEVVHHKNENGKDNRLENLEVLLVGEHEHLHGLKRGRQMVELKCPECSKIFVRRLGQTFLQKKNKYTCCSRSCQGKFGRRIQLRGRTVAVERAISGNIVSFFNTKDDDNREQTD
jgi:hypothetical protein